ncbi:MAG: hypothetical protein JW751_23905 [Polyangiaceae bacterium]|nr:hypothetical protein [Polyangiaceae bacterium]
MPNQSTHAGAVVRLRAWAKGIVAVALTAGAALGCEPSAKVTIDMNELRPAIHAVETKRVLFTHKSVGQNLLEGLGGILTDSGTPWKVVPLEGAGDGPALLEATPGENRDPRSKIDGFAELVRKTNPRPDAALMKLCFVDISVETDLDGLFEHYQTTVRALKKDVPDVVIVHVTVPLSVNATDAKSRVKRWLGRSVWSDAENAARAAYNDRLRTAFAGEPIFDLAALESTRPDGSREEFVVQGKTVPALVAAYASDPDGHLNRDGQRHVARGFLEVLAKTRGVTEKGK